MAIQSPDDAVCDCVVWSDADISGYDQSRCAATRPGAGSAPGSARPHHRHGFPAGINRVVRIASMRANGRIGLARPVPAEIRIFRGYQGLVDEFGRPKGPFLLASVSRFRYPDTCLACERPRP